MHTWRRFPRRVAHLFRHSRGVAGTAIQPPKNLLWLRRDESGSAWLDALPELVETCRRTWTLTLGTPYESSFVSLVVPAERADGSAAVLKIQFPHGDCLHEAEALRRCGGRLRWHPLTVP